MEVYIDDRVHQVLKEFYQAAMLKHPALEVYLPSALADGL